MQRTEPAPHPGVAAHAERIGERLETRHDVHLDGAGRPAPRSTTHAKCRLRPPARTPVPVHRLAHLRSPQETT